MKILAIDTSGTNCSIAIIDNDKIISEFNLNTGTTHSQNLVPMLEQIQKFTNIELKDIDIIACCTGPGSFTGIRIGIATVKGLALSLNKPVIGVSSLESLAYNVTNFDGTICSIIDAKNENVYAGIYSSTPSLVANNDYISDSINVLIEKLKTISGKIIFVGDGSFIHMQKLKEAFGDNALFVPKHLNIQLASSLARAAIVYAKDNKYITYDELTPLYLKKSQAERMLDGHEWYCNI